MRSFGVLSKEVVRPQTLFCCFGCIWVFALVAMLGACSSATTPGQGGDIDGGTAQPGPDGGSEGDDRVPVVDQGCNQQAVASAFEVVNTHCAGCHSGSDAKGGFGAVLDAARLRDTGKVVPFTPEESPLYLRIAGGSMPPAAVADRPDDADVEAIKDWILCGASDFDGPAPQRSFKSINDVLAVIRSDLRAVTRPADRLRYRYLVLTHLYNAGVPDETLDAYRGALQLLVNSLSRGLGVTRPLPIDPEQTVFRIDLRDYEWDADRWELAVEDYPYAVVYDADSLLYPVDEDLAEFIRDDAGTDLPWVQADWFVTHAAQAPLYYELLDLPETLGQLEAQLGVNINANIQAEDVDRAGFNQSGVSTHNRVIERHVLGGSAGTFWASYDFLDNLAGSNIFANPLDFEADGGEMIFTLPNGLQGYYIANAAGTRLDKAPQEVVTDPKRDDDAVLAGVSCMGCHDSEGIIPKDDQIRAHALATLAGPELEDVLALYPEVSAFRSLQQADSQRYRNARQAATDTTAEQPVVLMTLDHEGALDIYRAAATLGIPAGELASALERAPGAFPPEVTFLRSTGGTIQRDSFEQIFAELVVAIGLGQPL